MTERPPDYIDSDSENDDTNNQESFFLTRQVKELDDNSTKKRLRNGSKSVHDGEATLLETEREERLFFNSNQQHKFPSDRNKSVKMVDNHQQSRRTHTLSPGELPRSTKKVYSMPKSTNLQSPTRTKTQIISSPNRTSTRPINKTAIIETRRPISKLSDRSQSRSRSPSQTRNKRQGAFHIFTTNNHQTNVASSFTSNTPSLIDDRKRLTSSDDDDETNTLQEDDLKIKLKQEKRHGKKTGELFNKLHESYEELLEKYAQAENTIDQLRFQPRIFGVNTPTSNSSEHMLHIIQQPKMNINTLRSSGAYHSATASPFSSIRPVNSTTTTTTTPVRKSISPTNSGTIESLLLDEVVPQKTIEQSEDLLIQTKSLGKKMKSFLTLMDENQLSSTEQKQVYENIKQDYENLMKIIDRKKSGEDFRLDVDLNQELETMKQLLKEIVTRITDNLIGKSNINSPIDRYIRDESQSSQPSVRSSLCNHSDLMDQYKKLLTAVNTLNGDNKSLANGSRQLKTPPPTNHQVSTKNQQKPYVYVSGNSDDDHQQSDGVTSIPFTKSVVSTSFELDYIPSTSVKHHQEQIHKHSIAPVIKKKDVINNHKPRKVNEIGRTNKSYVNAMDENHFQSLHDEQESISSSSRSSGEGSDRPGSPYRFGNSYRRQPSDSDLLDTETDTTDSFNPRPTSSFYFNRTMPHSYHAWKPEKISFAHRSRLTPAHRSKSIGGFDTEYYKRKSHTSPHISPRINQQTTRPSYRSSIYIDQTHTHRQAQESKNLYLDPQTGVVYRYKTEKPIGIPYQEKLYQCGDCGSITTYHHRRHMHSTLTRGTTPLDDLGYESGYKKREPRCRYSDYSSSSSDGDSDTSSYLGMIALNEAYNRAEKVRHHSRCLSRNLLRQCKLALATI